jgi:hypothetical protein
MTRDDAADVQSLLRWLIDPHQEAPQDSDRARDAASRLADRSTRVLGDGLEHLDVTEGWTNLLAGCAGCEDCHPATVAGGAK